MVNIRVSPSAKIITIASVGLFTLVAALSAQQVQHYTQTNLIADTSGVAAVTDPNLVNPWGLSRSSGSPGSPWWASDNGPGLATLYSGTGAIVPVVVAIPPSSAGGQSGTPTGQIFNGTQDFQIAPGKPALFIFATEDGTVSGWNPGVSATSAVIKVDTKGTSVFKGIAVATINHPSQGATNYLYVADFRKGHVNVYDGGFHRIHLDGDAFEDERLPKGYAPFNVQNVGGNIYVAFAKQDSAKHDEVDGPGKGFVDVFSPTGHLLLRLEPGWWFNGPWGIAQAPTDFGAYSHDILVGQFGSGEIHVFDPITGRFKGTLNNSKNAPIAIDGLWAIAFGGGVTSGPSTTLFFTAGTDHEQHGLFGTITPVENVLGGDH